MISWILDVKNNLIYYFESFKDGSIGVCLDMWKIGIYAFIEYFIFGWSLRELDEYKKSLVDKGIVFCEFMVYLYLYN